MFVVDAAAGIGSAISEIYLHAIDALLAATALFVFFKAVDVRWSHSYLSLSDFATQRGAESPICYIAFRTIPVFAVAFFVSRSLAKLGELSLWPALIGAAAHASLTNGRAAYRLIRRGRAFGFWPLMLGHAVSTFVAILVAFGGWATAQIDPLLVLLPTIETLSGTLWRGLIAAILGAYVVQASTKNPPDPERIARKSRRTVSSAAWSATRDAAIANGTDPNVVRAIVLVENLQRPQWVRSLERFKGRFFPRGTYGVMQVLADSPIGDVESIELACGTYLRAASATARQERVDDWDVTRRIAASHNRSEDFLSLFSSFYYALSSPVSSDGFDY